MNETSLLYIVLSHLSLIMHNQKNGSILYLALSVGWMVLAFLSFFN